MINHQASTDGTRATNARVWEGKSLARSRCASPADSPVLRLHRRLPVVWRGPHLCSVGRTALVRMSYFNESAHALCLSGFVWPVSSFCLSVPHRVFPMPLHTTFLLEAPTVHNSNRREVQSGIPFARLVHFLDERDNDDMGSRRICRSAVGRCALESPLDQTHGAICRQTHGQHSWRMSGLERNARGVSIFRSN